MRVYTCFPGGKAKALTMSYDDGREQDIRLVALFNKYGIKGTFNLNGGLIHEKESNGKKRVPMEDIVKLYQGHEIAGHSLHHPTIERCPAEQIAQEILEDRRILEKLTGRIVRGHAYPNGSYNSKVKDILRNLGVAYGRVVPTNPDFKIPEDFMEWHPTAFHLDDNLLEQAQFFADFSKKQYMRLMYVWGHSYELDAKEGAWEKMEEFCKILGGREDIWYATNIEIVDYMDAAGRLQFSADCSIVYNPNAISVWLEVDGKDYIEVKGGETKTLC